MSADQKPAGRVAMAAPLGFINSANAVNTGRSQSRQNDAAWLQSRFLDAVNFRAMALLYCRSIVRSTCAPVEASDSPRFCRFA